MTLLVIFCLMLTAVICLIWKKYKISAVVCAFGFLIFLAIGTGEAPNFLLGKLQNEYLYQNYPNWQDKNVIILLGMATERIDSLKGDNVVPGTFAYSRIVKTAQLYKDCRESSAHCAVIVSGGDPLNNGKSEAKVYSDVLVDLGVDADDITQEAKSRNTFENAKFTSAILENFADRVKVLVTSGVHLDRSALYFKHFGVTHLHLVPSDYFSAKYSLFPIAYNFAITDFALHEYIGVIRYHIYNALGWNPPKPGAGVAYMHSKYSAT